MIRHCKYTYLMKNICVCLWLQPFKNAILVTLSIQQGCRWDKLEVRWRETDGFHVRPSVHRPMFPPFLMDDGRQHLFRCPQSTVFSVQ
jgi:hypothetical protein